MENQEPIEETQVQEVYEDRKDETDLGVFDKSMIPSESDFLDAIGF